MFGDELGRRQKSIKRAWAVSVLKAHGHKPMWIRKKSKSRSAKLSPESRALLKTINLHFHDLHREAASRWLELGASLGQIQRWLGHHNISQTSTYLGASLGNDADEMRKLDERRGRLTNVDPDGSSVDQPTSSDAAMAEKTPENVTVH